MVELDHTKPVSESFVTESKMFPETCFPEGECECEYECECTFGSDCEHDSISEQPTGWSGLTLVWWLAMMIVNVLPNAKPSSETPLCPVQKDRRKETVVRFLALPSYDKADCPNNICQPREKWNTVKNIGTVRFDPGDGVFGGSV